MALPFELYRGIIAYVGQQSDLRSLAATCRSLQPEAEMFLWHSVEAKGRAESISLCNHILSYPRLSFLIHSAKLNTERSPADSPWEADRFWQNLAKTLRSLHNLERLTIYSVFWEFAGWILAGCTFQLKELSCPFLDQSFGPFLETQARLNSLRVITHDMNMHTYLYAQPASQLLPELRTLRIDVSETAVAFITGRRITHLWLNLTSDSDTQYQFLANRCIPSFGPLQSLRVNLPVDKGWAMDVLNVLNGRCPDLRSFGFINQLSTNDDDLMDAIAKFKRLDSLFIFHVIPADCIRTLAKLCPSLRLIACLHYSYAHEYLCFPVNPEGRPMPVHDPDFALWRDV